ncbi:MAG TPA: adenylate kinase [Acidimicrobiales bacterium]|nr:adenylate kinase [Acidimicrobiales bacterium]
MRVLLVAAPGAGKGTQATRIAQRYGITHISSGDLLRRHVQRGTTIGRKVQAFVQRGDLVPDEIVISILSEPVLEAAGAGGYVLDGFPRTAHQAEMAYELAHPLDVEVQVTVALDVPRDELLRRLLHRAAVEGRADDTEAVILHRLDVYDETSNALLGYYDGRGILRRVDGLGTVDEVRKRIWDALDPFRRVAE